MRTHSRILLVAIMIVTATGVGAGVNPLRLDPQDALAADATVAVCDETSFNDALDTVQSTGGGTITFSCSGTITFTSQKTINTNVTIDGGDAITIDGDDTRLFRVAASGSLTLDSLVLQHGLVGFQENGGAVMSAGSVTVIDSTFSENTADDGGAIWNSGPTSITGSTFSGNLATSSQAPYGGAIWSSGPVTVDSSSFVDNSTSSFGWAGAIMIDRGHLTATNSTFSGNSAGSGGAIGFDPASSYFGAGNSFTNNSASVGGAMAFSGGTTATIVDSVFNENSAGSAGAIWNFSDGVITIINSTLTDNTATSIGGAAIVGTDGAFRLIDSTVSGNTSGADGGALYGRGPNLRIVASTFDNNSAGGNGGVMFEESFGSWTIIASIFTNNSAEGNGGVWANEAFNMTIVDNTFSGNSAGGDGGVIYNTGSLDISRNTFSGNSAAGDGGAIYTETTIDQDVSTSTFTGNSASNGGAIQGWFDGVNIVASTFTGNTATSSGGALFTEWGGISSQTSIVAGNSATNGSNCFRLNYIGEDGFQDLTIISGGYNVSNDASCGFTETGDIENSAAVGVAALADNGGPTQTMLPTGADTLDNADCTLSSAQDQRGVTRPATNCDRGAVDVPGTVPVQIITIYNADGIADEGSPVMLTAVADGPSGASLDYDFDCDDDSTYETPGVEDGDTGSASCTFPDNGSFDVNVQVCDGANCDTDTLTVAVNNVAPTITDASSDSPVDEGSPVTITVTATDPAGVNDPLTVSADCDDSGDFETVGGASTVQCTFADDGTYSVPVQVDDGDGGSATSTIGVTVDNADPVISSVTNDGPIDEPGSVTVTVTATDPAGVNDTLMYEFDCDNDSTYELGPQVSNSAVCSFDDSGSFTVPVRVTDEDGGVATSSTVVTVNNLDPTITEITNDGPVAEGSPATITVTATDPAGVNDPLMYEFDCDNDGTYEIGPQASNSAQCTYSDDGAMIVPARVTDDDGGEVTDSTTVTVDNVAPTVDAPMVDIEPSNEGQSVVASAGFTDPGTDDTHTCAVDYGDGSGPQAGVVDGLICTGPTHAYLDDDPTGTPADDYTVTVEVTDDDDGSDSDSSIHTVNNVDPVIEEITSNDPVPQGQPVAVTVVASDAGVNDVLTYSFDCDNNGTYETAGFGNQGECDLDPADAVSTIGVEVTDDDQGRATGTINIQQEITVCAHTYSGSLSGTVNPGICIGATVGLTLPAPYPVTLCASYYTGGVRWLRSGTCSSGEMTHVVPGDGPLSYCESLYTGKLRHSYNGQCHAHETPGVIPG